MVNTKKSSSRLFAVQILYEMELNDKSYELILKAFSDDYFSELEKLNNNGKPSKNYIEKLIKGVSNNQKEIDELISRNLTNRKLSNLDSLMRSILRISVYELIYEFKIPKKVVFNEYIEIAKLFFNGEEPSLINAVLDVILKNQMN